jgi:hypothetical protein
MLTAFLAVQEIVSASRHRLKGMETSPGFPSQEKIAFAA